MLLYRVLRYPYRMLPSRMLRYRYRYPAYQSLPWNVSIQGTGQA
jgi:hypothetical protein